MTSISAFSFWLGLTGIAFLESRCGASDPISFIFPEYKALDLLPSSTGGFSDVSEYDPDPTFSVPPAYNVYYYNVEQTGYYDDTVSPNYYDDVGCSVPSDSSWPRNGCVCFEPDYLQTSFYEMSREAQDVPTNAFGYRTAFDTSVTGGVTVAGWFKTSDTSGAPIYASESHPGIQYSHILTRGEKSSWAAGFNFGMGKWNGFRFEVILEGGGRITAQCPNQWYPGINIWHYVVATYDAEQGRIAMYVDNVLQGENFVSTLWPEWTREQRDIKWGTNEAQVGKTRIGNGYDASDKQFFGCTGGLTLYGGVVETAPFVDPTPPAQTFPEDCTAVTSCAVLQTLLEDSAADGSTAKICASETPIDCRATKQNAAKIVLDADKLGGTGKLTKAKCISNDLTVTRCVVDMSPNYNNDDPSGPYYEETLAYLGILMRDASSLYLEGFEFTGVQGNSNVNYVQDGSSFVCRGCVFRNILAGDTVRGAVARDLNRSRQCGPTASLGSIVFDQCMFEDNTGELIYVQDSVLTVTNSIFQNNIQEGSKKGGFITYTGDAVNSFDHTLANNTFIKNDASSSNNIWLNRGIPAVCEEDAPTGWQDRDDCQSLLTKYTDNCQFENNDIFSCSYGLFIKWPMNQCVEFETCAETSRSLDDIYPVTNFPDVSQYITCFPSISTAPSEGPSNVPSESVQPSLQPSETPSTSAQPSSDPSVGPSVSFNPTKEPSLTPSESVQPSLQPSEAPSTSAQPSSDPSIGPSVTISPTKEPSLAPSESTQPSHQPSLSPSKSTQPSSQPSIQPSVSVAPSLSARPSSSTEEPSSAPSTSSQPSQSPSLNPTMSSIPSSDPTAKPSDQPSFPPTISKASDYYPDWTNTEQICINDGATPEYIEVIQAQNYLYIDKQECCEEHFSWRVRQCMGNDEPVYYRDGWTSTCKKGETRDDYDIAFDTLAECCEEQVWWDFYGCLISSPKVIEFEYTINLVEFAEPTNCQDADAIAKRMQDAMDSAMPGGTTILVVGLGGITIENDVALGTTQCGGTISGGYQGDYSTASDYSDPPGTTTPVTFRVSTDCPSSGCTDAQSVQSLYDTTLQQLLTYAQGSMTQDIVSSAREIPPLPQLLFIVVDSASMAYDGTYTNPLNDEDSLIEAVSFTVEGELSVTGFDTSSFDDADKAGALSFFQAALETTLASEGLSYPVKVTDIVDGKIMYETFITADSASDASVVASSIEAELAEDTTRAAIASNAVSEASGSSIVSTFSSGFTIDANTETAITEIPVAKLIVEGQFLTSQVNFGSSDESYLEDAIYEVLLDQGVLSEGGRVEVTGYDGGVITYEVISYVDATSNLKSKADSIASQITQSSTIDQIASVANSSPGCCTPAFSVFESTYLSTSGVPSRGWWPDWDLGEMTCKNGGRAPSYMSRNYDAYFSASKRECCEQWFPYNLKGCVGPSIDGSTKEFFVPNWAESHCELKQEGDMDDWELADTFGSLEECCKKRFSYVFTQCCSASGSNECSLSSEILYVARDGKCVGETASALEQYEIAFSETSMRDCCASNFWWMTSRACCSNSGGC